MVLSLKGPLSGLRQFLATERPLKMMENAFYSILKAISILNIFKFLFWLFDLKGKRLHMKVNFKKGLALGSSPHFV